MLARSWLLVLATPLAFVAACGGDSPTELPEQHVLPPTKSVPARIVVRLSRDTITELGGTATVSVAVYDSAGGAMSADSARTSSSDTTVVRLAGNTLTATAPGAALVRAQLGSLLDSARILVRQRATRVLAPDSDVFLAEVGDSVRLRPTAYDANGNLIASPAFAWTTSAPNVVTVDSAGWVRARARGFATVTARSGGASASREVSAANWLLMDARLTDPGKPTQVLAVRADGSGLRPLAPGAVQSYWGQWSPDGEQVLLIVNWELQLRTFNGDLVRVIEPQPRAARWSPSGRWIAYQPTAPQTELWLVAPDGGNRHRIFSDSAPADMWIRWSPDETFLAVTLGVNGNNRTFIVKADGGGAFQLLAWGFTDYTPEWSPDGKHISLQAYWSYNPTRGGYYIASVMNPADTLFLGSQGGSSLDSAPWSPDGKEVTLASGYYLYRVDAASGTRTAVFPYAGYVYRDPAWSPDGSRLVVSRYAASPPNRYDLVTARRDGSRLQLLLSGVGTVGNASWRP